VTSDPAKPKRARGKSKAAPSDAPAPDAADRADSPPIDGETWELLVDRIRPGDPLLAGLLDHAKVASHTDGTLVLEVSGEVSERRLQSKLADVQALIAAQRRDVRDIAIGKVQDASGTPHQRKYQRDQKGREAKRREVERHPLVVELIERFGGTLGVIEIDEDKRA